MGQLTLSTAQTQSLLDDVPEKEPGNPNIQAHIPATNNPHVIDASDVSLENADNTSDINKPISTATQTALDLKEGADVAIQTTVTQVAAGQITNFTDANKPTPAAFGVGPIWIDGTAKWSDGNDFIDVHYVTKDIRVATFGDSTARVLENINLQDIETLTTDFSGGSTLSQNYEISIIAIGELYPAAKIVGNGGIGATTTTSMLARDIAAASTSRKAIKDIVDLKPDVVLFRASINDLSTVTSANIAATVAQVNANHQELIERFTQLGSYVIDEGIFGYSQNISTDPDQTRAALLQLNALYDEYALINKKVTFLPMLGITHDATGNMLSTASTDGIHLNPVGGRALAAKESELLTAILGASPTERFKGVNLWPDPLFLNKTTTAFGELVDNVKVSAVNSTRIESVEIINGAMCQVGTITTTATSASGGVSVRFGPAVVPAITAGKSYNFELDYTIESINGAVDLTGLYYGIDVKKLVGITNLFSNSTESVLDFTSMSGKIVLPNITITENAIDLDDVQTRFRVEFDTDVIGAQIKITVNTPKIIEII